MTDTNDIISAPTPSRKPATAANDLIEAGDTPKVLDALRAELTRKVKRQDVFIEVPERPNMLIRVTPNLTQHQIRSWRRNSGEETKAGLDTVKFSCYVLANTCTGISINNEMVVNDAGEELIFGDDAIINMLGVNTVSEAIKAIFVVEPHVESAALAVMEAAGFNDSVEQVDPTKTP